MSDILQLQQAIAAIKVGDKAAGRRLLAKVIRNDPRNEAAWLWMSAVTDSDEQRRACLERVLAINPDNQNARQGLARLGFTSQPPVLSPASTAPEPGGTPSPRVAPPAGQARRAGAALPAWSLLIALGATIAVCATIGIAAYLALTGAVGFLRSQAVRSIGPRGKAAHTRAQPPFGKGAHAKGVHSDSDSGARQA